MSSIAGRRRGTNGNFVTARDRFVGVGAGATGRVYVTFASTECIFDATLPERGFAKSRRIAPKEEHRE